MTSNKITKKKKILQKNIEPHTKLSECQIDFSNDLDFCCETFDDNQEISHPQLENENSMTHD
ncbi:unnamed protein product, partial [Brachionus calyciflorus]